MSPTTTNVDDDDAIRKNTWWKKEYPHCLNWRSKSNKITYNLQSCRMASEKLAIEQNDTEDEEQINNNNHGAEYVVWFDS